MAKKKESCRFGKVSRGKRKGHCRLHKKHKKSKKR